MIFQRWAFSAERRKIEQCRPLKQGTQPESSDESSSQHHGSQKFYLVGLVPLGYSINCYLSE
jgi:hypothetical protein